MYYAEPENILISIYDNAMLSITYDVSNEAVKLFNLIFLARQSYIFKHIGYKTPKNLQRYVSIPGEVEYPYASEYYQERDYPYI